MDNAICKKIFLLGTKWLPILGTFLVTIHYGIYFLFDIRSVLLDFICDSSLFPTLYIVSTSILFDYCELHKLCISYLVVGSLLIDLHRWFPMFFIHEKLWCFIMFIIGLVIISLLIIIKKICIKGNN